MRAYTGRIALALVLAALSGCRMGNRPYSAYVDKTGRVIIRFDSVRSAGSFSEGLAPVDVDGRRGYINTKGEFVIHPQFGSAESFSEGLAVATLAPSGDYWAKGTLFGYIDKSGQFAIQPRFNWASDFSEELAAVCTGHCRGAGSAGRLVGYIDRRGDYVVTPRFADAGLFSEGLADASLPIQPDRSTGSDPELMRVLFRRAGYIDKMGRFVIKPRFSLTAKFSHGLAATDKGFVNHQGELVIAGNVYRDDGFSEGWAIIYENRKPVFIDTSGRVVLRPQCESVEPFSDGLAAACVSGCGPSLGAGNWGYINKQGSFVIKPQFGYKPGRFKEGLALVCFGCEG